jgi:hypothetical protein
MKTFGGMMNNSAVAFLLEGCGLFSFVFITAMCAQGLILGLASTQYFLAGAAVLSVFAFFASLILTASKLTVESENQRTKVKAYLKMYLLHFGFLYTGVAFSYFLLDSTIGYLVPLGGYFVTMESLFLFGEILLAVTIAIIVPIWAAKAGEALSRKRLAIDYKTAAYATLLVLTLGIAFAGSAYAISQVQNIARESSLRERFPGFYETLLVQGVNVTSGCVYLQNTGKQDITITQYFVRNMTGDKVLEVSVADGGRTLPVSSSQETLQLNIDWSTLPSNSLYTITIVSSLGSNFVSGSFKVP